MERRLKNKFAENRRWLETFEQKYRRRLRVLHIGNIANNAYNNAKIQRDRGIDADVLSFDYYHVMAAPEWEDSGFSGDVGDPFFPDWWTVNLNGFRRPPWFVAGPLDPSIRYLLAKTANHPSANGLWRLLTLERWLLCRRNRLQRIIQWLFRKITGQNVVYGGAPATSLLLARCGRGLCSAGELGPIRSTRLGRLLRGQGRRFIRFARTANIAGDSVRHLRAMQRYLPEAKQRFAELFAQIGRDDTLDDLNFFYQLWWHPYIRLLFQRYDIVQCYATYTAMPFILNRTNYVAYEHGTIRVIPFSMTIEGRMCMASYRGAAAVFVTNLDNIEAAGKMQLKSRRVVCLPHAFDSNKLLRFAVASTLPQPSADGITTFIMAARQHWVDNDPGWAKGNDRVFAALRLLKDQGRHCVLRAVAWGNDLAASRARILELGIEDMVEWLPMMMKQELWGEYLKAHAVIDQFVVPAFGGISFEAMMLGRRVLTNIDKERAAQFFGAAPPLWSCRTSDEIATAMGRVIDDPIDMGGYGSANQAWMQQYHSADRIVALQTDVYRRLLAIL
jgi:glycosyltransferase involved in cell wall biosynthesis